MLAFQAGELVVAKRGGHCLEICHPVFCLSCRFQFLVLHRAVCLKENLQTGVPWGVNSGFTQGLL